MIIEGNLWPKTIILKFQRKGNNELAVQALNIIVADLQTQINNLSGGSGSGGGDPDGIGVSWVPY